MSCVLICHFRKKQKRSVASSAPLPVAKRGRTKSPENLVRLENRDTVEVSSHSTMSALNVDEPQQPQAQDLESPGDGDMSTNNLESPEQNPESIQSSSTLENPTGYLGSDIDTFTLTKYYSCFRQVKTSRIS